jgi:hypothetical protein
MTTEEITEFQLTLWGMIGRIPGRNRVALQRVESMLRPLIRSRETGLLASSALEARSAFRVWFSSRRWQSVGGNGAGARDAVYGAVWALGSAMRSELGVREG